MLMQMIWNDCDVQCHATIIAANGICSNIRQMYFHSVPFDATPFWMAFINQLELYEMRIYWKSTNHIVHYDLK